MSKKIEKKITSIEDISNNIDINNLTTQVIVTTAKQIIGLFDDMANGIQLHKQYELGKLFNEAVQQSKIGKKVNLSIIYTQLGIPKSTFTDYIKNYIVTDGIYLNENKRIPAKITNELIGNCVNDNIQHYNIIKDNLGEDPKRLDIRLFNYKLKDIAKLYNKEIWELAQEDIDSYVEPVIEREELPEPTEEELKKMEEFNANLPEREINVKRIFESMFGDCPREGFDSSSVGAIAVTKLVKMNKKEWNRWYRKASRCFHPDHGGSTDDFALLNSINQAMKVIIKNDEKQSKHDQWWNRLEEWKRSFGYTDNFVKISELANEHIIEG